MADVIIKILTPATNFDLLTLDELKIALGIATTDTSQDVLFTQMIDWYSAYVSQICNRVFARERLMETWRCMETRRIFLSHWPVTEDDIESVEAPRGFPLVKYTDYEIEEGSGKIELFGSRTEPIVVTYTGGYNLPDEAPDDLKNAAAMFIRQARLAMQREATAGIRSVSHKDSRVQFFDPNAALRMGTGAMTSDALRAGEALLYHYTRLQV